MKAYIVVSVLKTGGMKNSLEELSAKVNQECSNGWEPIGGIAVDDSRVYQAMVGTDECTTPR
jgi:hypothetical protein